MSTSCDPTNRSPSARHPLRSNGFSVVEVLVALMLVSIGILAIAGSSALTLRAIGDAERERTASRVAASRIALLSASGCGTASSGTRSAADGSAAERWRVDRAGDEAGVVDTVWWSSGAGGRVFVLTGALPC